MEGVWIALIVALVTGTLSPALLLWMKNRSDAQQRLQDAEFRRQERLATETREDAREARAEAQRVLMITGLETVKKQTDGVMKQVAELAKATGHIEGKQEATQKAEATATTLALGQQQGRDAERESLATKVKQDSDKPTPVIDKITNETGERAAQALEKMANAAQEGGGENTSGTV